MRKMLGLTLMMLIVFSMTGCLGKREINDLAMVMAVGIDKGENEQVKITTQIVRPADSRGSTGAPSGQTGDPIWSASAEGETLFDAIRNLSTFSSRRVFWAHNYAIVINEDYAREGIGDVVDFFTRNPELRMRTWVMVTPDEASKIVSTLTGLEVIPGEAINKLFRYNRVSVQAPRTQMIDVQSALSIENVEPVIARVSLIQKGVSNKKPGESGAFDQIELKGAGVFKGEKLVGTLGGEEVKGMLPFVEKLETGLAVLECPTNDTKKLSIELEEHNFKVTPALEDGKPKFKVHYDVKGSIVEGDCPLTIKDRPKIKNLEKQVEQQIKEQIDTIVNKAQTEFRSDFLEFGNVFHNRYPAEWKKIKNEWRSVFPDVKVETSTNAEITDSTLLINPARN